MQSVLRQLDQWRFRERAVRLAWGGARWLAIVGTVLAVACAVDWAVDRYSGSKAWRNVMKSTWLFAPNPLSVGETPMGLRVLMTLGQVALGAWLAYRFLIRPWADTPPVDDLATTAEKAFPEFDHRLVTAIQLNRNTADTRGMSKMLIGEVTREAGEIASKHNLLSLIDYRRLAYAAGVFLPIAVVWGVFFAASPALATTLVKRQALLGDEIPRNIHLKNVTREVWPTGSEVVVRIEVTGDYDTDDVGVLRVVPDGQDGVEDFYELTHEAITEPGKSVYSFKLQPSSTDFSFQARIGAGRTREPGRVRFEAPPQLGRDDPRNPPLTAIQILPKFLGLDPDKQQFVRRNEGWTRGEVVDALPTSEVIIEARFNKAVKVAWLVPIERTVGLQERELPPIAPFASAPDRTSASFGFTTTPRMIGYKLSLEDELGFTNPTPIRRNVRMWEDRPPVVEFRPETTRNPDPEAFDGTGNPKDYEWDMSLGPDGLVMVIYSTRSEVGIRAANIRYRVVPKGVQFDTYPEEYQRIQHPREDPNLIVYDRLPLRRWTPPKADAKGAAPPDLGAFVPDLGLFQNSFRTVPRFDRNKVNVEFYPFPSRNPQDEPAELEAGGRRNFEVSGLLKKMPDGSRKKLEIGDTVEVYVEVFDKMPGPDGKTPDPNRPAGYTREAKRKIVVSEAEAEIALRQRDEARQRLQDKLREIANDQGNVFKPKKP